MGLVSAGEGSVGTIPLVGLGGIVGFIAVAAASVGAVGFCLGLQLARAAPAATVAVSLMNVRREMGGRRVMGGLQITYLYGKHQ